MFYIVPDTMEEVPPQQFCLRWNNYQSNLTNVFDQLLQSESFVDVTLACDGNSIKAHKMVLSACSPYFQSLFFENPCQHPIVIMRDVKWEELKACVEFMYKGEINVSQEQIGPLLRVAESLKIRGLADVTGPSEMDRPELTRAAVLEQSSSKKRRLHEQDTVLQEVGTERVETVVPLTNSSSPLSSIASPPVSGTPGARVMERGGNEQQQQQQQSQQQQQQQQTSILPSPLQGAANNHIILQDQDLEIKPGIAEMIREEERVSPHFKLIYLNRLIFFTVC